MATNIDTKTTVTHLKRAVHQFISARNWESFHTSKNLAMSIAIEAAEIMEHFQWLTIDEGQKLIQDPKVKAKVADELADVMIYCLSFANQADIDVSKAIFGKLERNEVRFPVSDSQ